jgi:DNA end-binding protein Ku
MAARSIWNGTIRFGIVTVPIKLFSGVQDKQIRFRELHVTDAAPLQHKRLCPREDREVPYDEIVKGFEVDDGRYIVLTKEEAAAAQGERSKLLEIDRFVPGDQIDPVYYDRAYWIGPQKGAEEAYALLRAALDRTGRVGIGTFVLRTKEQLAAVHAADGALRLETMRFDDEVVEGDDLELPRPSKKVSEREAKMAHALVDSLVDHFKPEQYEDTYRQRVLELVRAKAEGKEIEVPPEERRETPDLLAALEASVAQLSGDGKSGARGRRPQRRRTGAKARS